MFPYSSILRGVTSRMIEVVQLEDAEQERDLGLEGGRRTPGAAAGAEPEGADIEAQGLGWSSKHATGMAGDASLEGGMDRSPSAPLFLLTSPSRFRPPFFVP